MSTYDDQTIEQTLHSASEVFEQIAVPAELDAYIAKGLAKGIKTKHSARIKLIALTACFLIAVLIVPIRVSPAFAALMSKIPGLEYVVKLINYDRGLMSAVENDFVQHINLADEHQGLVFTVKDVIVDQARMIIFYSLENKSDHQYVYLDHFEVTDEQGNPLKEYTMSMDGLYGDMQTKRSIDSKLELSFSSKTVIPDKLWVKLYLKERSNQETNSDQRAVQFPEAPSPNNSAQKLNDIWQVLVPIDKEKFENLKDEYALNQTVEIEGQKILFKKVTIYPTRIGIDLEFDQANTKQIFGFDDLSIVDEHGNSVAGIINGVSGTYPNQFSRTLYLQSNYFDRPKELYLEGSTLRALDKDKVNLKIDLEHQKILNPPTDSLRLKQVSQSGNKWDLAFELQVDPQLDSTKSYSIFNYDITDASGQTYQSNESSASSPLKDNWEELHYYFKADKVQSPITLSLNDYPTRISGHFKIRIK